jgi:2-amino-4-hydroxy-6-hydroxymethyldihydropteridine diphosphokinase
MHKIFLGIGTNMGNRESNLSEAVTCIGESIGTIVKISSLFETEPWGFKSDQTL